MLTSSGWEMSLKASGEAPVSVDSPARSGPDLDDALERLCRMQVGQGEGERARRAVEGRHRVAPRRGPILSLVISASKLGIRTYASRTRSPARGMPSKCAARARPVRAPVVTMVTTGRPATTFASVTWPLLSGGGRCRRAARIWQTTRHRAVMTKHATARALRCVRPRNLILQRLHEPHPGKCKARPRTPASHVRHITPPGSLPEPAGNEFLPAGGTNSRQRWPPAHTRQI